MASLQNPVGSSKAAKFAAANPLGPMADPFAGLDDDQKDFQKALSENINERLEKAVTELQEKHEAGTNEIDDPDRAPTGAVYRQIQAENARREQAFRAEKEAIRKREIEQLAQTKSDVQRQLQKASEEELDDADNNASDDDLDQYDDLLDDDNDPTLEAIRNKRLQELKHAKQKHAENIARGHGELRTITQDDFLPECTGGSEWVAIHFFHSEFQRCKIMDHHLKLIAPMHTTCKFLRIDAEKAPFFVAKLQIKTLPTLLVFRDGKTIDRLTGFEGLVKDKSEPDKWHTGRLQEWLAQTGAIDYTIPTEELQEEMQRMGLTAKKSIWSGGVKHFDEDD